MLRPSVLFIAVLLGLVYQPAVANKRTASVLVDESGTFSVVGGRAENAVAWAVYDQAVNTTGWAFLELHSHSEYNDEIQAYGAGYLEGDLTAPLVRDFYHNMVEGVCEKMGQATCEKLEKFVVENLDWMSAMMQQNTDDPYWYQIRLIMAQLQGMVAGYNNSTQSPKLTFADFLYIGINYDLSSIVSAIAPKSKEALRHVVGSGSCSAIVKVLEGYSDILFSHETWSEFQTMLRIYKYYDLPFTMSGTGTSRIPGSRVSFSSYPMSVFSGDDFYTINSGLAVMETTIGNDNPKLWKYVRANGTVLNYFRCIAANRLAATSSDWAMIYSKFNSGTYNNQWMVFDYKLFEPSKPPRAGAFVVLEQLPGYIQWQDQTERLITKQYWPSYNLPFYPDVYEMSGVGEQKAKYGDFFSYTKAPRALIFDRNHSHAQDLESMMDLMRYNNFKHDPLARCDCTPPYSGENGLSARSDLNPVNGTYPFAALGHRIHGGTDAKITSSELMNRLSALIVSGPTARQQPVFRWSTSGVAKPLGHPDAFDFKPLQTEWEEI